MAIKNTKLGGTDFSTPTARIKPTDLNDTNDAIFYHDGFTYIDSSELSHTGDTETTKRTYTFNKDVDGIIFSGRFEASGAGADSGYIKLYKNDVLLTETSIFPISGFYDSGGLALQYDSTNDGIFVVGTFGSIYVGIQIYINESFTSTDTFKLKFVATDGSTTIYSYDRIVRGINNKSSDTTWISLA